MISTQSIYLLSSCKPISSKIKMLKVTSLFIHSCYFHFFQTFLHSPHSYSSFLLLLLLSMVAMVLQKLAHPLVIIVLPVLVPGHKLSPQPFKQDMSWILFMFQPLKIWNRPPLKSVLASCQSLFFSDHQVVHWMFNKLMMVCESINLPWKSNQTFFFFL